MLTFDGLTEQARLRGMPHTKMRGIVREYLQVLIMKELCASDEGKLLYFTGGTYLRLVYGLKRFSEDLDFNTDSMNKPAFERLFKQIVRQMKRLNLAATARFDHWDNILSGSLIFSGVEQSYGVVSRFSKKEGISIKVETNRPKWKIRKESGLITGFGEMYPCVCTDKGALFADKIDALLKKSRGRHLYDIMFMLSNKYPVDKVVLRSLGITDDPLETIARRVKQLSGAELRKQAETLRPFLFNESEADLLVNAKTVIPALISKYRPSNINQ